MPTTTAPSNTVGVPGLVALLVLATGCNFGPLFDDDSTTSGSVDATAGSMTADMTADTTNGTTTAGPTTNGTPPTLDTSASGTDTNTDTGTTGDPGTSTGGGFIIRPDGGVLCHSACDTWAQDCPEGEKCTAWSCDGDDDWDGTRCSPIADEPGQPGDPCTVEMDQASGVDDCDGGVMCWDVDPMTLQGTCAALCTGDPSAPQCEDPDTRCLETNDGVLTLCLFQCDPLQLDSCAPGQACIADEEDFVCMTTVSGIGSGAGGPCQYIYDCQPGLTCQPSINVGGACDLGETGCCTPYCDLLAPDPESACFDAAQQCAPWVGGVPPPPLEGVGQCLLPP